MCPVLGYRRHGVVFLHSDQLWGREGKKVLCEGWGDDERNGVDEERGNDWTLGWQVEEEEKRLRLEKKFKKKERRRILIWWEAEQYNNHSRCCVAKEIAESWRNTVMLRQNHHKSHLCGCSLLNRRLLYWSSTKQNKENQKQDMQNDVQYVVSGTTGLVAECKKERNMRSNKFDLTSRISQTDLIKDSKMRKKNETKAAVHEAVNQMLQLHIHLWTVNNLCLHFTKQIVFRVDFFLEP